MPVVSVGFMLRPDGFFDRNPALDLPPPRRGILKSRAFTDGLARR